MSLHRISDERNSFWNPIRPKTFDELLRYCKKNYQVIVFEQLKNGDFKKNGKPLLVLSFDDGYYDFYEFALPILVKHGLPCNHNIVNECANSNMTIWTERLNKVFEHHMSNGIHFNLDTAKKVAAVSEFDGSWMQYYIKMFKTLLQLPITEREVILSELESFAKIDTSCRMMNWDEIKECASNGTEIGSHSYSHDSIGTIASATVLEKEINLSKAEIEAKTGKEINVFALPNGQTGKLADEIISRSEYSFVLYANDELNTLPLDVSRQLKISRINLVDEPFPQMALRMEQFHKLARKYARTS